MAWEYDKTNFDRNLAVVVGINCYKSESIQDLKTPVSDARALADLLETEYGYEPENVVRLFDDATTLTGLQTLLDDTLPNQLKPTESDRLIFYFAGHGIPRNGQDGPEGYLVPQDADSQKQDSFLPMSKVYEALSKLECHHLLVILDCCFAGTFRWAGRREMILILETVRREHYDRFIRYPAWQVMTSAAHDQEALDVAKLAEDKRGAVIDEKQELHSPFALALLEGLRRKADLIPDGVITAHELYLYLEQRVSQLSGERQRPGIYPMRLEYDRGEFVFTRPGFTSEQLKPAPLLIESNNPYRGSASFDEKHANFFFGRKVLVEELQRRLSQPNRSLTVVLGASGSGKSSLVKAGLIPDLRQESKWYILDPMRPDRFPFTALARAILPIEKPELLEQLSQVSFLDEVFKPKDESGQDDSDEPTDAAFVKLAESRNSATPEAQLLVIEDYFKQLQALCRNPQEKEQLSQLYRAIFEKLESLSNRLQNEPQHLTRVIRKWSEIHPNAKLLLTIDQFEELITMSQESQTETHGGDRQEGDSPNETVGERAAEPQPWLPFLQVLLEAIVECPQQLHIVLTLRSDFEPRFLSSPLSAYWKDARFPVRAMNLDELRQAIEGPALKQALYFEPPELVGKLIDEVGQMPGALPLLSFTLSELYIKLHDRWAKDNATDRALRIEDYNELGGVAGALTRRATQEYDNLVRDFGKESGKAYQATMRRVMLRMMTIEGGGVARRRVPESELVYPDSEENNRVAQVSDRLVKARLLVKGQEIGEPYMEPAHDFLVRGWDKLQKWLKEEQEDLALQQRLTPAANDWITGKGGLWVREVERLARLEKVFESLANNWLNKRETEFVTESKKQRLDELKEAERQRDEAIEGRISALNSLAEVRFRTNDQLGGLIAAIRAGKQLVQAPFSVKDRINAQTVSTLQEIVSGIQEYNRLQGHSGMVWDVSFHPNGTLLASASYDKTIKIWRCDGTLANTVLGHEADVVGVCFSHDGKMLASASYDKTVRLWHFNGTTLELEKVDVLREHTDKVTSVCFSPDDQLVASAGLDKIVNLWHIDGSLFKSLKNNSSWVWDTKFSSDGKFIALACADNTVRILNPKSGNNKIFKGHSDAVTSINFSPDGQLLASASADRTIKLWTLNGRLLKTLEGHGNSVWKVDFSADSQLIASASWDNTVKVWTRNGLLLQTLEGHSNRVWSARFKLKSHDVASASADNTIKLWKLNSNIIRNFEGHKDWVWSAIFSPDNQFIASASSDGTVKIWKHDGTLFQSLAGHKDLVDSVCFTDDSQVLASASADKTVKLWKLENGQFKLFKTLEEHTDRVRGLSFSSDGILASAGFDRTVKLWNRKGTFLNSLDSTKGGHLAEVIAVCFSPDDKWLASASYDHTIKLWECNGQLRYTLNGHTDNVIAVAFSPDSQLLASASDDKTLILWRIEEQKAIKLRTLEGHQGWVLGVSFSHDGKLLASASADNTIKLWDTQNGCLLKTLQGHKDWVLGVRFKHNERILASASADQTINWWNLKEINLTLDFEHLLSFGCTWMHDYLKTNPTLSDEDRLLCASQPAD